MTWSEIPRDIGRAIWTVIRPRIGMDVRVVSSYTDMDARAAGTVVGTLDDVPLLRVESRGDVHRYYVPSAGYAE